MADAMSSLEVRVFGNPHTLIHATLHEWLQSIDRILKEKPTCNIALAGGTTPKPLYQQWGQTEPNSTSWHKVHIFFTDERYVPLTDPQSNFAMVWEALLSKVPISRENIHPIDTSLKPITLCAEKYEEVLKRYGPPDLVLLGAGVDGHTASLFPGHPALKAKQRWVVAVPDPQGQQRLPRVTLTLPLLSQVNTAFFLLVGAHKRPLGQRLLDHLAHPKLPIQDPALRVRAKGQTMWFLDISALWE